MSKWRDAYNRILDHIDEEGLQPGATLPTDQDFARKLKCSVQPVIRAMQKLAAHGQVRRRSGAGTVFLARQPALPTMANLGFSVNATERYGHQLATRLVELSRRTPRTSCTPVDEKIPHKALGLKGKQEFYVISRVRILDDKPRVIHRVYLNPACFPEEFLSAHRFDEAHLLEVYESYGYKFVARQTILRAQYPAGEDMALLQIGKEPVLTAQQELTAERGNQAPVVLEFMFATYTGNWEYVIENRR